MDCSCKWVLTLFPVALIYLALGVQYTIMLPTVWEYVVKRFGGAEWLYSLCLAAASLSNIFFGPLFGVVYDKTHATKLLVLTSIACGVTGWIMYFIAVSGYMVLAGRLLIGLSLALETIISGEMARITTKKQRTVVYTMLTGVLQFGYVIGPGFNLVLRFCNFQLGSLKVDKCNAPGMFMALSWIIIGGLFLFCYLHLPTAEDKNGSDQSDSHHKLDEPSSSYDDEYNSYIHITKPNIQDMQDISEVDPDNSQLSSNTTHTANGANRPVKCLSTNNHSESPTTRPVSYWLCSKMKQVCLKMWWVASMVVWDDIVALLYVVVIMMFSEMTASTSFVPLADIIFHWSDVPTSIFFTVTSLLMVFVSIFVSVISKRVSDRWTVLVSLVLELLASSWLTGWLYFRPNNGILVLIQFIIGNAIILLTEPVTFGSAVSLFSKLLPPQVQGVGHGVRRSLVSIGSVLGSLWAAAALHNMILLYGVPIGLLLVAILLVVLSFKKLKT